MPSLIQSILRSVAKHQEEKYNVISFECHERFQTSQADINANFWLISRPNSKKWNYQYGPMPNNFILLNEELGDRQIPPWLDLDLVLSHNKLAEFQVAKNIASNYHLPYIHNEHCLPPPNWSKLQLAAIKNMQANHTIFISDYSRNAWGYNEDENSSVIHHGIDTDFFTPANLPREKHILAVANDYKSRNWCLNFDLYLEATYGLPTKLVGNTPGYSKAAKDVNELLSFYQTAQVGINTSIISPVPMAVLEMAACEVAICTTDHCMLKEIFTHEYDALIANDPVTMRKHLKYLLANPTECARLGANARQTIMEKFSLDNFVANWNNVLDRAAKMVI
jgi:glycosyltransferase involved in cell wall biosynthesis